MNEGTAYTTIIVFLALALIAQVMLARFWKRRAFQEIEKRVTAQHQAADAMKQVERAQRAIRDYNSKLATVSEWPEVIGER